MSWGTLHMYVICAQGVLRVTANFLWEYIQYFWVPWVLPIPVKMVRRVLVQYIFLSALLNAAKIRRKPSSLKGGRKVYYFHQDACLLSVFVCLGLNVGIQLELAMRSYSTL